MEFIKLIIGLILLLVSGDFLVRGGVSLARHFKVSTLVVGITVVAFGTSAPELIVSLQSALSGHPEIAIGNVVGSNIANIALVLGLTAVVLPMPVKAESLRFAWPVMFACSVVLYYFMSDSKVVSYEGIILFIGLLAFIFFSLKRSRKSHEGEQVFKPVYSLWICIAMILASCGGLALGSNLLIEGASDIAAQLGVSERIISITIVAFGTSLPELAASLVAAFRGETDISIGNIIGSNIFNIMAVIGLTASIHVIPVPFENFEVDMIWMLFISILLLLFSIPAFKNFISFRKSKWQDVSVFRNLEGGKLLRVEGAILFVCYVIYVVTLF